MTAIEQPIVANDEHSENAEEAKKSEAQPPKGHEYKQYKSLWMVENFLSNPFEIFKGSQAEFEKLDNPWKTTIEREPDEEVKAQKEKSNIDHFFAVLSDLLSFFESTQQGVERSNSQIVEKYPKYLSKQALFALQMDDSLFREIFTLQILIFAQSIVDPVGIEHKNNIKLTQSEEQAAASVQSKAAKLLRSISKGSLEKPDCQVLGKRTFGESLVQIVQKHEPQWASWKKQACPSFEVRGNQRDSVLQKLQKRRQSKAQQKKLLNSQPMLQAQGMNVHRGAQNLHRMLRAPADFPANLGAPTIPAKKAAMKSLSDYIYEVLMDIDPAQLIDDDMKHRHDQLFCWRILKLISQFDLTTFSQQPPSTSEQNQQSRAGADPFKGNIEDQVRIFCKNHMKREIPDHLPEEEPAEEDEGEQEEPEDNQDADDDANDVEMIETELAQPAKPAKEQNGHTAAATTTTAAEK